MKAPRNVESCAARDSVRARRGRRRSAAPVSAYSPTTPRDARCPNAAANLWHRSASAGLTRTPRPPLSKSLAASCILAASGRSRSKSWPRSTRRSSAWSRRKKAARRWSCINFASASLAFWPQASLTTLPAWTAATTPARRRTCSRCAARRIAPCLRAACACLCLFALT